MSSLFLPEYVFKYSLVILIYVASSKSTVQAGRRPIYIIGHMTNSIKEVIPYLNNGANALESDIQFFPNGSVKEVYHGYPGDCFRICNRKVKLADYLKYLRKITEPSLDNTYYDKLIMQFFDLKLSTSKDKEESGRDLAKHILDYMWSNGERKQEIRALVFITDIEDKVAIYGFLKEFQDRGQLNRLKDVGFDGGMGSISATNKMLQEFEIDNVWQGDGNENCLRFFHSNRRLKSLINERDSRGFIKKVYDWTVDIKFQMRKSLNLEVDGFITNKPNYVIDILNEKNYKEKFRVATTLDSPFLKFEK